MTTKKLQFRSPAGRQLTVKESTAPSNIVQDFDSEFHSPIIAPSSSSEPEPDVRNAVDQLMELLEEMNRAYPYIPFRNDPLYLTHRAASDDRFVYVAAHLLARLESDPDPDRIYLGKCLLETLTTHYPAWLALVSRYRRDSLDPPFLSFPQPWLFHRAVSDLNRQITFCGRWTPDLEVAKLDLKHTCAAGVAPGIVSVCTSIALAISDKSLFVRQIRRWVLSQAPSTWGRSHLLQQLENPGRHHFCIEQETPSHAGFEWLIDPVTVMFSHSEGPHLEMEPNLTTMGWTLRQSLADDDDVIEELVLDEGVLEDLYRSPDFSPPGVRSSARR